MARGLGFSEQARRDILRRRDKVRTGHGKIGPKPTRRRDPKKTLAMHLIEVQFDRSIEELIAEGEIREVGKRLGLQRSTISVWRKRLGLRE